MGDQPKCVALTGASGFVGGYILKRLLLSGVEVRVLARHPQRLKAADARMRIVEGDLFDPSALKQLVDGVDAVIHLVGIIAQVPQKGQTFDRVHRLATENLLDATKEAKVKRWVHMSALGSRPGAVSQYHRSKWAAEESVRASGLDYTIFRPSLIHGWDGEFMQMVKGFCCNSIPPFMPYFGAGLLGTGGAGKLQPVWVEDVARCFVESLSNTKAVNETYPMGGLDEYTWPQLYITCHKHIPGAVEGRKPKAIPVWYAKLLTHMPFAPFNMDQIIMSQENSTCPIAKVQEHFGLNLAAFEPTLEGYASQIE